MCLHKHAAKCCLLLTLCQISGTRVSIANPDVYAIQYEGRACTHPRCCNVACSQCAQPYSGTYRLQVLAFSGSYCTIADPEDAGMLDVPGLDAGVPEVMRQFVLGEL